MLLGQLKSIFSEIIEITPEEFTNIYILSKSYKNFCVFAELIEFDNYFNEKELTFIKIHTYIMYQLFNLL